MKNRNWTAFTLVAALASILAWNFAPPPEKAEAQVGSYSYAVKFVCGFNRSNIGTYTVGAVTQNIGEATVKLGNYATEINIFNPQVGGFDIKKKVVVLYRGDSVPPHIGREPNTRGPSGSEGVFLDSCFATMDDCNKIYELAGIPIVNPPILTIGFLQVQSPREVDVTAVYTAELCSDQRLAGGAANLCNVAAGQNYGVSLSIDVEQIQGKLIQ